MKERIVRLRKRKNQRQGKTNRNTMPMLMLSICCHVDGSTNELKPACRKAESGVSSLPGEGCARARPVNFAGGEQSKMECLGRVRRDETLAQTTKYLNSRYIGSLYSI